MRVLPLLFAAITTLACGAMAGPLQVLVLDKEGKPVRDAVVVVYPDGQGAQPVPLARNAIIEQEKMRFVPALTVVPAGATVRFTNLDRWDHHVRGAPGGLAAITEPALGGNNFEMRLPGKIEGRPASYTERVFDQPGAILLGCHLHGSMRGHVFVTDSAWTLQTGADGLAEFPQVPGGPARLRVWHAEQILDLPQQILSIGAASLRQTVQLSVVPRTRRM